MERYYERIACFFRTKAEEDMADLIQRTFLTLLESQDRIREGKSFHCFLFGIARNTLFEHYRSKRRERARFEPEHDSVEDLSPSPTAIIAEAQETRLLLEALRRIPIEFQIILDLYYWEDMTAKEIASVLDVPEGTARTRLRRAKQLLEAQLAECARTPHLLKSTLSDLDSWSAQLRAAVRLRE